MSIGRNREEQALTSLLASTLVKREVLDPMGKIGWGHGTPPPPETEVPRGPDGQPIKAEGAPTPVQDPTKPAAAASTAAPPVDKSLPAPVVKTDAPAIDLVAMYEGLRDPATGLISKKYKTVEEAIKGSGHLATMAKQSFTERDVALAEAARLREENIKLRTQPAPLGAAPNRAPGSPPLSRAEVDVAQERLDKVLASLKEDGAVLDAETMEKLSKAQRDVSDASTKFAVQEALSQRDEVAARGQEKWQAVDAHMRTKYPESFNFSDEMSLHISSDPVLQAAVGALVSRGQEIEATELAWTSLKRSMDAGTFATTKAQAEATEVVLAAKEQARQEALTQARKDAGVVTGSAGGVGVHQTPNAVVSNQAEIDAARDQMRMEGDAPGSPAAARFRHLIIGQHLDPSLFPGTNR